MGNWTTDNASSNPFKDILSDYYGTPARILEIGSYDGSSAVGFLSLICSHPDCHVTCIDPFEGSRESHIYEKDPELAFMQNTAPFGEQTTLIRKRSSVALREMPFQSFDIIYIDGSHDAKDVLSDAVLSWDLLKVGGIMIFDDYLWKPFKNIFYEPKLGIDSFYMTYQDRLRLLHKGERVFIRKERE